MLTNAPIVELLTPKIDTVDRDPSDDLDQKLDAFKRKYHELSAQGFTVSIPDSPMGVPRFTAMETIDYLDLEIAPDRLLWHINTFHPRREIDEMLNAAAARNVTNILCVSGDGNGKRHRLEPAEIGDDGMTVTSVELISYIRKQYPSVFNIGVAFNQWALPHEEFARLRGKVDAGAQFIITQPFLGPDTVTVDCLLSFDMPLFLGIWFSKNLALLSTCVDAKIENAEYDPFGALECIVASHKECGLYVSLLHSAAISRFNSLVATAVPA